MSLKENIDAIKEELTAEEKFLESVIKSETFYKKHKKLILTIVSALVVGVVASAGYNYIKEKNLKESNKVFLQLINQPDNKKLEDELKSKNPNLYNFYRVSVALKSNDLKFLENVKAQINDPILKDLISYQEATLSNSSEKLLNYASKSGATMKELAYFQAGFKKLQEGDRKKASDIFGFISPTSSLYQLVQGLNHYIK